jgi:hypothetical protein
MGYAVTDENESTYPEFTADDLRANARGVLTDAQRERLIGMMIPLKTVALILCITIIAMPVCMNLMLMKSLVYISPVGWVNGVNAGITVLLGIGCVVSWRRRIAYLRELDTTTVEHAEGVIRKENLYQWDKYYATKLSVGETDFLTHIALTKAFKAGKRYRVYYLPESKQIVSYEKLDRDDLVSDLSGEFE